MLSISTQNASFAKVICSNRALMEIGTQEGELLFFFSDFFLIC